MTNNQGTLAQGQGHALKTHPQTTNGIITEIKDAQQAATNKVVKETLLLAKNDPNTIGKIFLIAPTGTRDTIARQHNNKYPFESSNHITMGDDDTLSVEKTLKLIQLMLRANPDTAILLCGVNESHLKNPKFVNPDNNEWSRNCYVPMQTQLIPPDKLPVFHDLVKNKLVMPSVAKMVRDIQGKTIGSTLDTIALAALDQKLKAHSATHLLK